MSLMFVVVVDADIVVVDDDDVCCCCCWWWCLLLLLLLMFVVCYCCYCCCCWWWWCLLLLLMFCCWWCLLLLLMMMFAVVVVAVVRSKQATHFRLIERIGNAFMKARQNTDKGMLRIGSGLSPIYVAPVAQLADLETWKQSLFAQMTFSKHHPSELLPMSHDVINMRSLQKVTQSHLMSDDNVVHSINASSSFNRLSIHPTLTQLIESIEGRDTMTMTVKVMMTTMTMTVKIMMTIVMMIMRRRRMTTTTKKKKKKKKKMTMMMTTITSCCRCCCYCFCYMSKNVTWQRISESIVNLYHSEFHWRNNFNILKKTTKSFLCLSDRFSYSWNNTPMKYDFTCFCST